MIPSGICQVAVLIAGRERLRFNMSDADLPRVGMTIAEHMPELEAKGRVAVIVTPPNLVTYIVARSRS